jgi:hypothetical protein
VHSEAVFLDRSMRSELELAYARGSDLKEWVSGGMRLSLELDGPWGE